MDFGPSEEISTTNKLKLGKRQIGDVLEENCEARTMTLHQKRARVRFGNGMFDSISARVELSRAWEPLDNSKPSQNCEGTRSLNLRSYGNQVG